MAPSAPVVRRTSEEHRDHRGREVRERDDRVDDAGRSEAAARSRALGAPPTGDVREVWAPAAVLDLREAQLQQQQSAMVTSVMALLPVMGSAELEAVYRACVALLNRRQSER